jgi:hypothetical protein
VFQAAFAECTTTKHLQNIPFIYIDISILPRIAE